MPRSKSAYRIFVSSPGDVKAEREVLKELIEDELQKTIGADRGIQLEAWLWEYESRPGMGDIQQNITEQIGDYDIFVSIFWTRFGTPTERFDSGTEEEFRDAYDQWRKDPSRPILIYFCERPSNPSTLDVDQLSKVRVFREEIAELGMYWTYTDLAEFRDLARKHLYDTLVALDNDAQDNEVPEPEDAVQEAPPLGPVAHLRDRIRAKLDPLGFRVTNKPLDQSGANILFRAKDEILDRDVVIKTLVVVDDDQKDLKTFCANMKTVARIKHRNLVTIYDGVHIYKDAEKKELSDAFVICEFIDGQSLEDLIKNTGRQPVSKVVRYLIELSEALIYAHKYSFEGYHFRPSNILIDSQGSPVLTAFRLAALEDDQDPMKIMYSPPEDIDEYELDRSAQFRLGLIAYEMLQGKEYEAYRSNWNENSAYNARNRLIEKAAQWDKPPTDFRASCPADLWGVVQRLLSREPGSRFSSLESLKLTLQNLTNGQLYSSRVLNTRMVKEGAVWRVKQSFNRCRMVPGFFEKFYTNLIRVNEELKPYFRLENPDRMEALHYMLREAIDLLLNHVLEPRAELLRRVSEMHTQRGITASFYDDFRKALLITVINNDPYISRRAKTRKEETQQLISDWRRVIKRGIAYMKKNAAPEPQLNTSEI